jgi:hypothetical protein
LELELRDQPQISVRALKTSLGVDLTIQVELYKHRAESTSVRILQLGPQSTVLLGRKELPQYGPKNISTYITLS